MPLSTCFYACSHSCTYVHTWIRTYVREIVFCRAYVHSKIFFIVHALEFLIYYRPFQGGTFFVVRFVICSVVFTYESFFSFSLNHVS